MIGVQGFGIRIKLSFFAGGDRFAIDEKRVDIAYPLFYPFTAVALVALMV